jgi:hypothetical protein
LESLQRQSEASWRLIALLDRDDGCNRRIIQSSLPERSIEFIDCDYPTQGFPAMLNAGLSASTAEFVARQDDDDVSMDSRFELQTSVFQQDPEALVVAGFARVTDETGTLLHEIRQPPGPSEIGVAMIGGNIIPHSSVMFRRRAILEIGGYDPTMYGCEDYDLWLRILQIGTIRTIGECAVEVLQHSGGMSRSRLSMGVVCRLNRQRWGTSRRSGLSPLSCAFASAKWSIGELGWFKR